MLRSLVGSEMCIRDSGRLLWLSGHPCSGAVRSRRYAKGPPPHISRQETCLLYTSDAADDLLCVDLGGRRIITKKHKPRNPDTGKMTNYTKPRSHTHQQSCMKNAVCTNLPHNTS